MSLTQDGGGATEQYVPFTPFQEVYEFQPEPSTPERHEHGEVGARPVTPFVSEYAAFEGQTLEASELHELFSERRETRGRCSTTSPKPSASMTWPP